MIGNKPKQMIPYPVKVIQDLLRYKLFVERTSFKLEIEAICFKGLSGGIKADNLG
ncbi:hypothetical protein [Virgibacillus sp. 6R]|uniref:hypothetical protein n=1 Tax=Virgibacillus sp. 6R TaxID=1911587 RepID=UPI0012EB8015|nr:hypothetical protein [Virgibacillus sp. 6R]